MKELELTVKINQNDDSEYPYELNVYAKRTSEHLGWHRGKTLEETIYGLYESLSDNNLKCWYMLEDK